MLDDKNTTSLSSYTISTLSRLISSFQDLVATWKAMNFKTLHMWVEYNFEKNPEVFLVAMIIISKKLFYACSKFETMQLNSLYKIGKTAAETCKKEIILQRV